MDDLLSEDWQKPAKASTTVPASTSAFSSNYNSFRASPTLPQSGRASPANLSRPSSTVNGSKAAANDSFGSLLSLKTAKAGPSLSMQERQKQLLEEKRRQQEQQAQLWNTLGSGTSTPDIRQPSPAVPEDDNDILAAFNKDAPVNRASHFAPPPPSGDISRRSTPAIPQPIPTDQGFDDDDDPFGLSEVAKRSNGHVPTPAANPMGDDDDILGDLGRPVNQQRPPPSRDDLDEPMLVQGEHSTLPSEREREDAPGDRALAELVDMGFPADTAKIALAENNGDVQGAVGWLLQQAHEESRQKARSQTPSTRSRSPQRGPQPPTQHEPMPSWMRQEERSGAAARRRDDRSPANDDSDSGQASQELGSKFFKSANALWKAGQKTVAKTIADLQQEGESSQPKWMRDGTIEPARPSGQRRPVEQRASPDLTDEAAMLDAPRQRPSKPPRPTPPTQTNDMLPPRHPARDGLPSRTSIQSQRNPLPREPASLDKRPATKLSRQDVEDQTAQAYVSPARRKRPVPNPEPQPEPEVDLFSPAPTKVSSTSLPSSHNPQLRPVQAAAVSRPSPPPSKPKVPPRSIPSVSTSALAASASHRKAGGEHFKRGDYAAAHESYTAALAPLPPAHPIAVIVLSNRSLTALKTGDAKVAVSDADRALEIIGPSLGVGETIDLGAGDGTKEMKEFYGKALMRKAEALEHMEKYLDAAAVWRLAIEAGAGGAVSLRGRDRCEKAAAPKPSVAVAPKPTRTSTPGANKPPAKALGSSLSRPTITSVSSGEAVRKLRAANAEAEKADDEKFALADIVDAKLTAWRGGKTDNLRALLQSMDAVLWEGAGWKKVGMSDLVMPNKVKVVYMKAIAKVHPDKVS